MRTARGLSWLFAVLALVPTRSDGVDCRECAAQSLLAVANVRAPAGGVVKVPVLLSDATATPLGPERGNASQIGGFAWRVRFVPASAVLAARVLPVATTRKQEPLFESAPRTADGISCLVALAPGDAAGARPAADGETLAVIELTLAPRLARGTRIELRLDPLTATLSNAAGTLTETVANGHLRLKDGAVEVE